MKNVLRSAMAIALILAATQVFSQVFNKGCIIAEGNNFGAPGNKVKMAHYYPIEKKYVYFDSMAGDFTNEVLCDGAITYIHVGNADATKDSVFQYSSACGNRLKSAQVMGFQKMKSNASKLIVSKGFGADSNYIEIFDKNTMNRLATITEVDEMCNGIAILGNTAYVAVNGTWPSYTDSGTIAVIDLLSNSFVKYIKLDTNAKVVNRVYARGNTLWCECDFDKIVEYNLLTDSFVIYPLSSIQGTFGLYGDYIAYSTFTSVLSWNVLTHTTLLVDSYYGDVSEFRLNPDNYGNKYVIYNDYTNGVGIFMNSLPLVPKLDSFVIGLASVLDVYVDSNIAPVSNNYFVNLQADYDTSFTLNFSDTNLCDRIYAQIFSGPQRIGASASITAAGVFTYTPAAGLVAKDTVQVSFTDVAGASAISTIYIHVFDLLGIAANNNNLFYFYPNPASDQIQVSSSAENILSIEVLDMMGQVAIASQSFRGQQSIDISDLHAGTYLLKILDSDGKQSTQKLFKN